MAAQEPSPTRSCAKCFAVVVAGADYCPECGAPIETGGYSEGSDAEINPELARANLLRMRGEYKQSEDVCLAILRRFPNNLSANTLLGDISAESGDLDQAVQWYELALDLQPDSAAVARKLEAVRQRKSDHEAATTAKQLGLPTTRPKGAFVAIALLAFIVCIGIAAYSVGRGYVAPPAKQDVESPVNVPDTATPRTTDNQTSGLGDSAQPPSVPARPKEDRDLMDSLSRKNPDGAKIIDAYQDPRSKDVVLTFTVQSAEEERPAAARLAASTLDTVSAAGKVTLRVVRDGKVAMVADATREALASTRSSEWQDAHKDEPDAWMDEILTNIWRPS